MLRVFHLVTKRGPPVLGLNLERVLYHVGLIYLTLALGPYIMR